MVSENFEKLFEAAKLVREKAHVPYSNFKVGAAFLTSDNNIITGCNVENAAYPQSQCAEATAIGNMISNGSKKILSYPHAKCFFSFRGYTFIVDRAIIERVLF